MADKLTDTQQAVLASLRKNGVQDIEQIKRSTGRRVTYPIMCKLRYAGLIKSTQLAERTPLLWYVAAVPDTGATNG